MIKFINDQDLRFARERLEAFRREADLGRIVLQSAAQPRIPLGARVWIAVRDRFDLARSMADAPTCAASERMS